MNKRKTGAAYEELAMAYLMKHGIRIVERNFHVRQGEIDLIGYDGQVLVFFEVKYRTSRRYGLPVEAVGMKKQLQICRVAAFYRVFHQIPENRSCRYDVIAITAGKIEWYQNAFLQQDMAMW